MTEIKHGIKPLFFEWHFDLEWQVSSIVFVDSPVGTGFSYARSSFASRPSDSEQVGHALQFLRKVTRNINTNLIGVLNIILNTSVS